LSSSSSAFRRQEINVRDALIKEIKMAHLDGMYVEFMMLGIFFLMAVPIGGVLPEGVRCGSILLNLAARYCR
jgi:hypothetical protein